MGEAQYDAKCDDLRGFVFEPLRAYMDAERKRSGLSTAQIQDGMHLRTGARYVFAQHTFGQSQWGLPTEEQYLAARAMFDADGDATGRPYLRREYEELRREYEELRRPFFASESMPYTDVWEFPTVVAYPGKHTCEKPEALAAAIVEMSSRPGDVVLDCVSGSGAFPAVAVRLGRHALACDADEHWADVTRRRCEMAARDGQEHDAPCREGAAGAGVAARHRPRKAPPMTRSRWHCHMALAGYEDREGALS